MYEAAAELKDTRDLNQGDILARVPRLRQGGSNHHLRIDDPKAKRYTWPVPESSIRAFESSVRVVQPVQVAEHALVLSNSCDNYGGDLPLLLAPIAPFEIPPNEAPERQWLRISSAATGTARPKYFYLPGSNEFSLVRSEALLGEMYFVSHEILRKYMQHAGSKRVCTLKSEAVRHLQWAIATFFSRNPRDDHAWPSDEDFRLKMKWLEAEIARGDESGELKREFETLSARLSSDQQVQPNQTEQMGTRPPGEPAPPDPAIQPLPGD